MFIRIVDIEGSWINQYLTFLFYNKSLIFTQCFVVWNHLVIHFWLHVCLYIETLFLSLFHCFLYSSQSTDLLNWLNFNYQTLHQHCWILTLSPKHPSRRLAFKKCIFFFPLAAPQSVLLLRLHHGRMPDSLYGNLSDLCLVRLHCHWAFNWSGPSFYFISKCCQIPCILLIIYLFVQNHYSHTWTGFGLFFLWWSIHIQQMLHFLVIKHSTFIEIRHLSASLR